MDSQKALSYNTIHMDFRSHAQISYKIFIIHYIFASTEVLDEYLIIQNPCERKSVQA